GEVQAVLFSDGKQPIEPVCIDQNVIVQKQDVSVLPENMREFRQQFVDGGKFRSRLKEDILPDGAVITRCIVVIDQQVPRTRMIAKPLPMNALGAALQEDQIGTRCVGKWKSVRDDAYRIEKHLPADFHV